MAIKIALAGNPNSGKTTLFNALTGANQFVGNWPGVTVEKKEGKLKGHADVVLTDLPGIYSLSPYTLEEVVARNYILNEKPDAILNIVDGTNLERNLYLSTQLLELGIPVVMAVNMADVLEKNGDVVDLGRLKKEMGCEAVQISALKGTGVQEAADLVVKLAKAGAAQKAVHRYSEKIKTALSAIENRLGEVPADLRRFYAIKVFERDEKILESLKQKPDAEQIIAGVEKALDDDAESIIANERYNYITGMIHDCLVKKSAGKESISDKIDKVVTNRILALPIFALIMFIVYYVSVTTVGSWATDWANDGVFGDGWHLTGAKAYEEVDEEYGGAMDIIGAYADEYGSEELAALLDDEAEEYDGAAAVEAVRGLLNEVPKDAKVTFTVEDEETLEPEEITAGWADLDEAVTTMVKYQGEAPDPADYGVWVPGIPVLIEGLLDKIGCGDVLKGLILDGIVAGVGAVLGFVPQILILFIFLAFLENCGYMARIAFIMDRIFRRFGLSGKSFIPILIGTGCGIPGIMASRTIENERDRRMTIMTTTFIPCGAKLPFIGMVAGAIFGGAWWVAPSAYFLGIAAIICSGIILKKTKLFAGDPAPFVMELPAYHWPTVGSVLRSMWERGWSFIKKAGTIILLSTIVIWFGTFFGFTPDGFRMLAEDEIEMSILAKVGSAIAWIFAPLGFGTWQATVASITGLVAKENIVGTMGIVFGTGEGTTWQNIAAQFTSISGYAFLAFNLLCAPCFAAMGAIKREMNSRRWFWIAFGYQMIFAWLVGLCVNQIGGMFTGAGFGIFTVIAIAAAVCFFFLLFRPEKKVQG
ncbi:MAG: ferrous iron transporter B [Lachnospiraceae bacterium]|nr:ferrous iron transporter B [Lachnospiraceae bacterium]